MDPKTLAPYLDFANHKPIATESDIKLICNKTLEYGFNSAFMNPVWVQFARQNLGYTGRIGTIVSFSLGQDTVDIKIAACKKYIEDGTNELDILLNLSNIKEAKWDAVLFELTSLVNSVKSINQTITVKCIPECGYLTPDEIKKMAELMVEAKVDFFKTCSGMGPRGANLEDVKYVKEAVGNAIKIKVAGGVDTLEEALAYIEAGVSRMGTSHALSIIGAAPPQSQTSGE